MGDHDDGHALTVQLTEQFHQLKSAFGIQSAGRLVCQKNARIVDECARNSDTLLLSAGKLCRIEIRTVRQTDAFQSRPCPFFTFLRRNVRVNIGSEAKVRELVAAAKDRHIPIRIGVNGGSLEKDLLRRYGVTAEAMVESALSHAAILERCGFEDIVLSLKASTVKKTIEACRIARERTPYPLHLGITEAGSGEAALVKSAVGIGAMLLEGVGDTIRVSLTGSPVNEVHAAKHILRAVGLRTEGVDVVSCPTCGRTRVDLASIVEKVKNSLPETKKSLRIAVMGCAVNGPGEAREADLGIAFGSVNAVVFKKGELCYSDKLPGVIDRFIEDVRKELE